MDNKTFIQNIPKVELHLDTDKAGTISYHTHNDTIVNCRMGKNVYIENFEQVNLKDCEIGDNTRIYSFVNAYGCRIGKNCKIGSHVEIQKDVIIGDNVTISSHTFLCSGVEIKGNNFIGHNVITINDINPVHNNQNYEQKKTEIREGANIGSGAILFPVIIMENAVVGAGAVVREQVGPGFVVVGNPARRIR